MRAAYSAGPQIPVENFIAFYLRIYKNTDLSKLSKLQKYRPFEATISPQSYGSGHSSVVFQISSRKDQNRHSRETAQSAYNVRMDMDQIIGFHISEWRREAGLSQDALAQSIGMQQTAISKIEAGKQSLTVEQLLSILEACGISGHDAFDQLSETRSKTLKPLWERIDE